MDNRKLDSLVRHSANRAFSVIVNEMRIETLREDIDSVEKTYGIDDIVALTQKLLAGQFGHDPITLKFSDAKVTEEQVRSAIRDVAPEWDATIDDDGVTLTVDNPLD